MKMRALASFAAGIGAVGGGVFHYFSDMLVCRRQPTIPAPIRHAIARHQTDDLFASEVATAVREIADLPRRRCSVVARDGTVLRGYAFVPPVPRRVLLLAHGWRSNWRRDFSPIIKPLYERGCVILCADQRAHGESDGEYITLGSKEAEDVVVWAQYLSREYPSLPLYLWGMSMGATSVLRASVDPELPHSLRGIIADCGYCDAEEELVHLVNAKMGGGGKALMAVYRWEIKRRCGFDLRFPTTVELLPANRHPLLLFHGCDDDFVPVAHTLRNFAATGGERELCLVANAAHEKSFYVDGERCFRYVDAFFERNDELKGE